MSRDFENSSLAAESLVIEVTASFTFESFDVAASFKDFIVVAVEASFSNLSSTYS